jgi:hypothetical protein
MADILKKSQEISPLIKLKIELRIILLWVSQLLA